MILCHERKFILLKTTKVGGTSMEIVLSQFCGAGDIITPMTKEDEAVRQKLGYRGPQNYRKPLRDLTLSQWVQAAAPGPKKSRRPRHFYNHMTAQEIRTLVSQDVWRDYLKVSIVRNPFDYAVSRYFFAQKQGHRTGSFRTFLATQPETLLRNQRITHIDGQSVVDLMLRYEDINAECAKLGARIGLTDPECIGRELAGIKAKGSVRPRSARTYDMFNEAGEDSLRLVEILCAEDIERYGYDRPSAPAEPLAKED